MSVKPSRDELLTCMRVPRWADALAGQSYDTLLGLERTAVAAATPLSGDEVEEALFSVDAPAASQSDDPELARRLAEGNAAYQERFGRAFVINASGRGLAEIVDELERRLENGPAAENAEVANQLRGIALVRLRALYGDRF